MDYILISKTHDYLATWLKSWHSPCEEVTLVWQGFRHFKADYLLFFYGSLLIFSHSAILVVFPHSHNTYNVKKSTCACNFWLCHPVCPEQTFLNIKIKLLFAPIDGFSKFIIWQFFPPCNYCLLNMWDFCDCTKHLIWRHTLFTFWLNWHLFTLYTFSTAM